MGQHIHFDVSVGAVKRLNHVVDASFVVVGIGAPLLSPGYGGTSRVFLENQLRGERGSKSVRHPIATRTHQIVWRFNGAVKCNAHVSCQDVGDDVIVGSWSIVEPIHQHPSIVKFCVHGVGPIVSDPDGIGLSTHHFHTVHRHWSAATIVGQVGLRLVDVFREDDHATFLHSCGCDLLQNAWEGSPRDGQNLDFFPLRSVAQVAPCWWLSNSPGQTLRKVGLRRGEPLFHFPRGDAFGQDGFVGLSPNSGEVDCKAQHDAQMRYEGFQRHGAQN